MGKLLPSLGLEKREERAVTGTQRKLFGEDHLAGAVAFRLRDIANLQELVRRELGE